MPYSTASVAVNQRSRSLSAAICSTVRPVCCAVSSCITRLVCSRFSAWIAMSTAVPPMPADGWCIITRVCGSAYRLPLVPVVRRNWPMLAAKPNPTVTTSFGSSRMVS